MSDPLTVWPMRTRSKAIALMPTPPTPTMCRRRGRVRSSDGSVRSSPEEFAPEDLAPEDRGVGSPGTGVLLDEIREPRRGVGPAQLARGGAHPYEPVRFGEQL